MRDLVALLMLACNPATLPLAEWEGVIRVGRVSRMLGRLHATLEHANTLDRVPSKPRAHLDSGRRDAEVRSQTARWDLYRLAEDLALLPNRPILLKGGAYLLASPNVAAGRTFNDLDILVPAADLGLTREALERAGWSIAAMTAYDVDYYERWSHELPPMQHPARRFELDVHHGLVPVVGRVRPPMDAIFQCALPVQGTPFSVSFVPGLGFR